jgi:hypothetical protein
MDSAGRWTKSAAFDTQETSRALDEDYNRKFFSPPRGSSPGIFFCIRYYLCDSCNSSLMMQTRSPKLRDKLQEKWTQCPSRSDFDTCLLQSESKFYCFTSFFSSITYTLYTARVGRTHCRQLHFNSRAVLVQFRLELSCQHYCTSY